MEIRRADPTDAPALVAIINRAFQVEKFFIEGDRIDLNQVQTLFRKGEFLIAGNTACVYIEPRDNRCYLGLLSVDPQAQGTGLGGSLLKAAEDRARKLSCQAMDLRMVNLRKELPAFYQRMGYEETGTSEFTAGVQTLLPCHFVHMSKLL
jgi:predicted N-acetyltransferase YhbS